ncbi:MAG: hypothetical protein LBD07_02965 [Spirochaetaceae bacterium]|jgi:hypothetical protein|nr:hypothetical protein [Spirochaetaceae bacterium]
MKSKIVAVLLLLSALYLCAACGTNPRSKSGREANSKAQTEMNRVF